MTVHEAIKKFWSMDFVHDQLPGSRSLGLLNVIDDYNREPLGMEIDFSLPSKRVILHPERVSDWCGRPDTIWYDSELEKISAAV